MSRTTKAAAETEETNTTETTDSTVQETVENVVNEVKEKAAETVEAVKDNVQATLGIETMANTTGKMGVVRYCQKYSPNAYITTLLKTMYPTSFYTKAEWDQIVEDLLNKKVTN